jgi:flagellar protein FlgJ
MFGWVSSGTRETESMDLSLIGQVGAPRQAVSTGATVQDARLRKVCGDFESVFLHYILKSARHSLPESKLFDNSHESRLYRSMMDEKMAISMAQGGGAGLGQMLYDELRERPPTAAGSLNLSEEGLDPIKNIDPPVQATGDSNEDRVRDDSSVTL